MSNNILEYLKKPYVKTTILITAVIIFFMLLTQSLWMDAGINTIYKEHPVSDVRYMNGQTYIVKGQYNGNYLQDAFNNETAYVVVSNLTNCKITNGTVKLLVVNKEDYVGFAGSERIVITNDTTPRVLVIKVLEGCDK